MWKQLGELGRKLLTLIRRVDKLEESDKVILDKVTILNERVSRLTEIVQHLTYEFQRNREHADAERRIQLLEIENRFLRYDRQLPPPDREDTE